MTHNCPDCDCGAYEAAEHRCLVCREPIPASRYDVDLLGREYHADCRRAMSAAEDDLVLAAFLVSRARRVEG